MVLHDNIRCRGAMTKHISNCAQVKIIARKYKISYATTSLITGRVSPTISIRTLKRGGIKMSSRCQIHYWIGQELYPLSGSYPSHMHAMS